ncbi:hypothetical protein J7E50_14320 [Pedobacter sp. ISL-68]|uniref:hypothetical protein n=1 Tax=Pedobacter sp. ISL-68 TaxID=2819165 RepID=UPI001BE6DC44|nr:hypothetical protein [Pedobacter sp. ISL-68]MBT2591401.1 hypothetical protein [Pedobacter sp. ISL-68]
MNNQLPVNRVEMELSLWRSREERFSKLFSFNLSSNKSLLKEKLQYYERIAAKYKGTQDVDERFALNVLRQERNKIEKQLYPNLLIRLLRRLLVAPIREQIVIRQNVRQAEINSQSLHSQLQRAGFTNLSTKLDEQIRQSHEQFNIPVSYYINEKERLDHQLYFAKDQTGQYQFEGYKTSLHNELKPEENRQQYFSMKAGYGIDSTEAHNLLAGRSIQKDGTWVQLDFNDKDPHGNYRIKEFQSGYGYDLEKVLQQLPLKELLNKNDADKLQDALKQGSRQSVSFIKNGNEQRYYIEANPQFKSVNIYDEHSRKITLATALGNKTMEALKVNHKINEGKDESQSKRNGLRVS